MQKNYGTGRRKTATARVFLSAGTGTITINNRSLDTYFGRPTARMVVRQPLELIDAADKYDVIVTVKGGGIGGQVLDELQLRLMLLEGRGDIAARQRFEQIDDAAIVVAALSEAYPTAAAWADALVTAGVIPAGQAPISASTLP